jgi:Rrf2 family protein
MHEGHLISRNSAKKIQSRERLTSSTPSKAVARCARWNHPQDGTLVAMRLGHTTKYALEALAFLIRSHAREELAQISEIAEACDIPRKYLEQVLLELKNSGLVESKKGQHGGYRLSRSPDQITLGEVVSAVQGELLPLPEWLENSDNNLPEESGLREVVLQARGAVERIFEATSIEVLVCRPESWT